MAPYSFLTAFLPALPNIPFPSLPQNIQRRLLAFLLRKSIGKFVRGGLDAEAIEADLGKGTVKVQALELESDAITPLLDGLPLSFQSGTVGLVAAQVSWPLSLSSAISIEVEDLTIVLQVTPSIQPYPFDSLPNTSAPHRSPEFTNGEHSTMEDSVISSAASEFVRQELSTIEDEELRESLHPTQSVSEIRLPGAFGSSSASSQPVSQEEAGEEVTMLAGIIERILSRLSVKVKRVKLRLVLDGQDSLSGENVEIELRVGEIAYSEETGVEDEIGGVKIERSKMEIIRSLRVLDFNLLMKCLKPSMTPDEDHSDDESDASSVTSDSSSDSPSPEQDMYMSQSIADLRTSIISTSSGGGGESLYASAKGTVFGDSVMTPIQEGSSFRDEQGGVELESDPFVDPEDEKVVDDGFRTIISLGSEEIVFILSTRAVKVVDPPIDLEVSMVEQSPLPPNASPRHELNIHAILLNPITLLLIPDQTGALISLLHVISGSLSAPTPSAHNSRPSSAMLVTAVIRLKSILLVHVYETDPTQSLTPFELESFWSHPLTSQLSLNHLRIHLDNLGIALLQLPDGEQQLCLPLRAFSIIECVRLPGMNEMRNLPILISDSALRKSYDFSPGGRAPLPTFESTDWIENKQAEGRGWRVKPKVPKKPTAGEKTLIVAPALNLTLGRGKMIAIIEPVHILLDLTIINRLLPLIQLVSDSLSSTALSATQTLPSGISTPRAQFQNLRDFPDLLGQEPSGEGFTSSVQCALVRLELRCPPPTTRASRKQKGIPPLRSGIFVLDLHDISFRQKSTAVRVTSEVNREGFELAWSQALAFFLPVQGTQAVAFLAVSAFEADPSDPEATPSSRPQPTIFVSKSETAIDLSTSRESLHSIESTTTIDCTLQLLRLSLVKAALDGIQFFVDDLTQWSDRTFGLSSGDGTLSSQSSPNPKIVGSRYFGAKSFYRGKRADSLGGESVVEGAKSMVVLLKITDVVIDLFTPNLTSPEQQRSTRHLQALVSDLSMQVEVLKDSKNNLHVEGAAMDLTFQEINASTPSKKIIERTIPRRLISKNIPLLTFDFTSAVEKETGVKESKIQLVFSNFTYNMNHDSSWIRDITQFLKAPAGAFESVVPNELTRLRISIKDGSLHLTPPNLTSRLVLCVDDAKISTNIVPDMPRTLTTIKLLNWRALIVNSPDDLADPDLSSLVADAYWRSKGYVELVNLEQSTSEIRQGNGLVLPDFELLVMDSKLLLSVCADSVGTIQSIIGDLTKPPLSEPPSKTSGAPLSTTSGGSRSLDLLASVDIAAFDKVSELCDSPEYLKDDVPANVRYLAGPVKKRGSTLSASAPPSNQSLSQIISDIDGETIRMLDPRGLNIIDDFLQNPREDTSQESTIHPPSVTRYRLSGCDITIHIHEGYDWFSTRKAIEEKAKSVRRRLEKIRQLLASGQKPDSSGEEASVLLFGSIQLGLPPGASDLPADQLLAAINEELEEESDVASSTSSWQPLPGQPSVKRPPTLVGKSRKRLSRSKSYAIEVNLHGVEASYENYSPKSQLASQLRINITTFDIIDNIRTSTWRKFLTELRASDGGTVRASGASMLRFEMNSLRASGKMPTVQEEITLKMKISPLRLYIDQDALEFLKAFGAFKDPSSTPERESTVSTGPFFQRVEIMPVRIKLDYKPKRVDYHALRKGKTAELMNFFHFDGSEMTLRHLVVTGISGSTRLSELVQDIWTPDVKANQLADVISGIAPVRSVVNVGSGVANLVLLPIEQYRKDGRLARGIQKGATAFARSTTLEALNVGARLATGTQVILEQVEAVLGARFSASVTTEALAAATTDDMSLAMTEEERIELISRYAEQPGDLREGIESAYRSLGTNFRSAAQTILAVPMEVYERSGSEGPVRAVIRAVPIAVLKPMIGASEAVSKALFGLHNTLNPDAQAEAFDKYKRPS